MLIRYGQGEYLWDEEADYCQSKSQEGDVLESLEQPEIVAQFARSRLRCDNYG